MSSDHEALKQASERLESLERELRRTREELYRLMALVDRGPATVFLWRIAPRWPVEYSLREHLPVWLRPRGVPLWPHLLGRADPPR